MIIIFGSCQRDEKPGEHEGDSDTSCSWCHWNGLPKVTWGTGKVTRGTEDQKKNWDHPDHSPVKIS